MGKIMKEGVPYTGGGSGSGTSNYLELSNKPQINGVTLVGNKSLADLGVVKITDNEIDDIINNVFDDD